jgi:hypothetical protein
MKTPTATMTAVPNASANAAPVEKPACSNTSHRPKNPNVGNKPLSTGYFLRIVAAIAFGTVE